MGKKAPAPPPDYTAQKNQIRKSVEAQYRKQADDYNKAVADYNVSLGNYSNQFDTLSSDIGGLSYTDLYDDPTTAENENPYSGFETQVKDLGNAINNLSFNQERPYFAPSAGSEYGTIGIQNIPTLNTVNRNQYDNLARRAGGLRGNLNQLMSDRRAEEDRVREFRNRALADIVSKGSVIGNLDISDEAQMDLATSDLARMDADRVAFNSPILAQMYPSGFSQVQSQISGLGDTLQTLRDQRAAEQTRIADYKTGLQGQADEFRNRLSNLTIADETQMSDLLKDIDAKGRDVSRFSSVLPYDFAGESGDLHDLYQNTRDLERDRADELQRINRATQGFVDSARQAERSAEGGNIYSAAALDRIDDTLRDVNADIAGFSSVLPTDFTGVTGSLTDAGTALAALRERRTGALDDILSQIVGATGDLPNVAAHDQAGLDDLTKRLTAVGSELGQFSGGRVGGISDQLTAAQGTIDTRLEELASTRADLEAQAQSLMNDINNAQFYAADDLGEGRGRFDTLSQEVELYNAQQALDELKTVEDRLNSERARLERDAEAVTARERLARDDVIASLRNPTGVPQFDMLTDTDPITLQRYLALLRGEEEEELPVAGIPSAFSRNVLVS